MPQRNLSINQHFRNLAAKHTPKYRFAGATRADWQTWHDALRAELLPTLGTMPTPVPLNPQIITEWREDGLIKQRLWLDVEEGLSVTAWLFRPEKPAQPKLPAILACHGHGIDGKDHVMGVAPEARHHAFIRGCNGDYGLQMAKAGYIVMAIDWRGFGERDDHGKPNWNDTFQGRDTCNVHYLRASILGQTLLGGDIHDGRRAIDYLCSLPDVDADRIGAMGLSFGGTMTTWLTICDPRIRAADIICYSDRFADFAVRDANVCGSQITPGLYALCDVSDLHGLIAPRPLLVESGVHDACFGIDSAMSCYHETQKIYAAAGAADQLELDLSAGGHAYSGRKAVAFFDRHLHLPRR